MAVPAWAAAIDMNGEGAPRGYVMDTNVLSNRADGHNPHVVEWMKRHAGLVFLSAITVAEMRRGLVLLDQKIARIADRKVQSRERLRLDRKTAWYREVTGTFANRILPIDVAVAEIWAEISVRFPSLRDGDKVIAATALAKGFGVATENLGDFRACGVPLMNPFDPGTWIEGHEDDPIRRLH